MSAAVIPIDQQNTLCGRPTSAVRSLALAFRPVEHQVALAPLVGECRPPRTRAVALLFHSAPPTFPFDERPPSWRPLVGNRSFSVVFESDRIECLRFALFDAIPRNAAMR